MSFFDLVKSKNPAVAVGKRYAYRIPIGPGKFRYVYLDQGKKGGQKGSGKGKGPKPPVDTKLDQPNFSGQPFNAAAYAALGKVVSSSSDRKIIRDRFGAKWGLVDGHLVRLSLRNQKVK